MEIKQILRRSYKTFRVVFMTIVVVLVVAYGMLYLLLFTPYFQNKIRTAGERELSNYLGTNVTSGRIMISPFNQLVITGLDIPDQSNGELINVEKLGTGISMTDLIFRGKLVFTFAEVDGLHGHVTRPDKNSPTNLQFIIDKLKSKPNKRKKTIGFKIKNAILRNCDISYDVLNEPRKLPGVFDPNHLHATDLVADLVFPHVNDKDFIIDVRRLAVNENNGLKLRSLTGKFVINDHSATYYDLVIDLPNSHLTPASATVNYSSLSNAIAEIKQQPVALKMTDNHITPADLKTFEPKLARYSDPVNFTIDVEVSANKIDVKKLKLDAESGKIKLDLEGTFVNYSTPQDMDFDVRHLDFKATDGELSRLTRQFAHLSPLVQTLIDKCGTVHITGSAIGDMSHFYADAMLSTDLGNVPFKGDYHCRSMKDLVFSVVSNLVRVDHSSSGGDAPVVINYLLEKTIV